MLEEIKKDIEEKKENIEKVQEEKKEEKPEKNTEETGIKRDEKGRFVEGTNPPPGPGRPKGSRDFKTVFNEALKKIAKAKDLDPQSVEVQMVVRAVIEAMGGDFNYFKYLSDRNYGKIKNNFEGEINVNGIQFKLVTNKEDADSGERNKDLPK